MPVTVKNANRIVGWAGGSTRTATAAFGRPLHSNAFEITEAVASTPILAGCTRCTTTFSASRMPPSSTRLATYYVTLKPAQAQTAPKD